MKDVGAGSPHRPILCTDAETWYHSVAHPWRLRQKQSGSRVSGKPEEPLSREAEKSVQNHHRQAGCYGLKKEEGQGISALSFLHQQV